VLWAVPGAAQVDSTLAAQYFSQASELCRREGGRLWGESLCGPMVFADPVTGTLATNQPPPDAERPKALGYSNAAMKWGKERWSTFLWQQLTAADDHKRAQLMLHELFHRIQPDLGLLLPEPDNRHLDTLDGRTWLQLEWRALARALESFGSERRAALADALAFRGKRRSLFPDAAENERVLEINEGLPQYTATVASVSTHDEAVADAVAQLEQAPTRTESFVRTFAYASGAAYGVLMDGASSGWTHRLKPSDDLGGLLADATGVQPARDPESAAARYGVEALRASEKRRDAERTTRLEDLRRRFRDGPVLVLPWPKTWSFQGNQVTPLDDLGTVYPGVHADAEWGNLEASEVLVAADQSGFTLPAPGDASGNPLRGDGWTLALAPGWTVRAGDRPGDLELVPE